MKKQPTFRWAVEVALITDSKAMPYVHENFLTVRYYAKDHKNVLRSGR